MKNDYKNLTVTEGLINSLEDAIKYEKGKRVKGVKVNSISVAPLPDYKAYKIKEIRNKK